MKDKRTAKISGRTSDQEKELLSRIGYGNETQGILRCLYFWLEHNVVPKKVEKK